MAHLKKSASNGRLLKNASGHLIKGCGGTVVCDNSSNGIGPASWFVRFAANALQDGTCSTCGDTLNSNTFETETFGAGGSPYGCSWEANPMGVQECTHDLDLFVQLIENSPSDYNLQVRLNFQGIGGGTMVWEKTYGSKPDLMSFLDEEIPLLSDIVKCAGLGSVYLTPA